MARDHFIFDKQQYEITDRVWLGRKEFLLSKRLSTGGRNRFLAFDPIAGPQGSLRIVQFMPRSNASWQRVTVLHRISQRNPELPQIIEFHRKQDEIVSVESWIQGHDLRWWIRKMRGSERQRLGTPEAIRLFRQLAHALQHLHRHAGIVHADIKPANIVVSNNSRRLALIDFGSAWGVERTNRRSPGDGRSEVYCAPEVLFGAKSVDFRADYFSLAVVCYEVLTLETPYDGLGGRAGLSKYNSQQNSLFVPPSQLSRESCKLDKRAWDAIDSLLVRALQIEPDKRHSNGNQWLADWDSTDTLIRHPEPRSPLSRLFLKFSDWLDSR